MKHLICLQVAFTMMSGLTAVAQENLDVFLFLGQSNMAGRGYMEEGDGKPIEGCYVLDASGKPLEAAAPLNYYSSAINGKGQEAIGPAFSFCRKIHQETGHQVLVVSNARGGSSLDMWMPGADSLKAGKKMVVLFSEAVRRGREAQKYGAIKAILWHQGESGAYTEESYMRNLALFVASLRSELGLSEDVPFIAGELGGFTSRAQIYNPMIHSISDYIPGSGYVSSAGCGQRDRKNRQTGEWEPDPQHFSREGQIILGERYADAVLKMVY